jgi:hypothetical protein
LAFPPCGLRAFLSRLELRHYQNNSRLNPDAMVEQVEAQHSQKWNRRYRAAIYSFEIEGAALPCVNQTDHQDRNKDCGFDKTDYPELAKNCRPWIEEH